MFITGTAFTTGAGTINIASAVLLSVFFFSSSFITVSSTDLFPSNCSVGLVILISSVILTVLLLRSDALTSSIESILEVERLLGGRPNYYIQEI